MFEMSYERLRVSAAEAELRPPLYGPAKFRVEIRQALLRGGS